MHGPRVAAFRCICAGQRYDKRFLGAGQLTGFAWSWPLREGGVKRLIDETLANPLRGIGVDAHFGSYHLIRVTVSSREENERSLNLAGARSAFARQSLQLSSLC